MGIVEFSKNIYLRSAQFAEVVSACRTLLYRPEANDVLSYVKNRLAQNIIDKFNIGYFPPNDKLEILYQLVDRKTLLELGVIYPKTFYGKSTIDNYDIGLFDQHNLIIPYSDEYGNIVALAGRSLLDASTLSMKGIPKYKNFLFNKSMHLFGLYQSKNAIEINNSVVLVEGQFDCMSCHASGIHNTVAVTGSDLTVYQAAIIKRRTNKLHLLFDNDEAGKKATDKIIRRYSDFFDINILKLPSNFNDVDEYIRNGSDTDVFLPVYNQ